MSPTPSSAAAPAPIPERNAVGREELVVLLGPEIPVPKLPDPRNHSEVLVDRVVNLGRHDLDVREGLAQRVDALGRLPGVQGCKFGV